MPYEKIVFYVIRNLNCHDLHFMSDICVYIYLYMTFRLYYPIYQLCKHLWYRSSNRFLQTFYSFKRIILMLERCILFLLDANKKHHTYCWTRLFFSIFNFLEYFWRKSVISRFVLLDIFYWFIYLYRFCFKNL